MLLSSLGHTCRAASSGELALVEAARFKPDVVICDIGLPDISGYEVARALRSRFGANLYLAALTGWNADDDKREAFEAGFDQHLVKPVNAKLLRSVMAAASARK